MAQNNENMKNSPPWLLSCYQQRNAAQAQGHSRSRSDAAGQPARQQAARRPRTRWCGGVWGPGRGGAGLPPPSARSLLAAVNADALLDQRRPPHAGKPEPPRLGVQASPPVGVSARRSAVSRVSLSAELDRVWPRVGGGLLRFWADGESKRLGGLCVGIFNF